MALATGGTMAAWIGRAAAGARVTGGEEVRGPGRPPRAEGTPPPELIAPLPRFTAAVEHSGSHRLALRDLAELLRSVSPLERTELIARFATSSQVELRLMVAHALRHVPTSVGSLSAIEHLSRDEVFEVRAAAAVTARLRLHDAPARLRAVLARF